jgi:hypothetical protein
VFTGTDDAGVLNQRTTPCQTGCEFASQLPSDYITNPGLGLIGGWTPYKTIHDTVNCPLSILTANEYNHIGIGAHIPATCTFAFVELGKFPPQDVYATTERPFLCVFCPGFLDTADADRLRAFSGWCTFWLVGATIVTILSFIPFTNVKKTQKD